MQLTKIVNRPSCLKLGFTSSKKQTLSLQLLSKRNPSTPMLFFSYFKDLVGREVTVELKNDLAIRGTLHSVDQYLNIKLENTRVVDQDKFPHMLSVRNCFIRGSVVRYVQLPPDGVDIELLHDATRREARGG
ncbi:sm-like protein LSM2 [Rutidosis leptorrhynchoides]